MTLFFTQETGEILVDDTTGNEVAEQVEIPVMAVVTAVKDASRNDVPGVDITAIPMRGYIVDFGDFVGELPISDRVRASLITNPETGGSETGWFTFHETVTPFMVQVGQTLGVPISGLFNAVGDGA